MYDIFHHAHLWLPYENILSGAMETSHSRPGKLTNHGMDIILSSRCGKNRLYHFISVYIRLLSTILINCPLNQIIWRAFLSVDDYKLLTMLYRLLVTASRIIIRTQVINDQSIARKSLNCSTLKHNAGGCSAYMQPINSLP